MKRMNPMRAVCALTLSAFAPTAFAIPIHFDFTGSITSTTGKYAGLEGVTVTGGFQFETDELASFLSPDLARAEYYVSPMTSAHAYLTYGDQQVPMPAYPQGSSAGIVFSDTDCYYLVYCSPASPFSEGFEIFAASQDEAWEPGYVGEIRLTGMAVGSYTYDYADFIAYDWALASPLDVVTRALHEMGGSYYESFYTCTGGLSCDFDTEGGFGFSIDSVTRGIGPRSVSEPGPLALFVAGLLGLCFFRRPARFRTGDFSAPTVM